MTELADVPKHILNEVGHFFDIYKELEPGKSTDVRGWMDRAEADRVIKEAEDRFIEAQAIAERAQRAAPIPAQRADETGAPLSS